MLIKQQKVQKNNNNKIVDKKKKMNTNNILQTDFTIYKKKKPIHLKLAAHMPAHAKVI